MSDSTEQARRFSVGAEVLPDGRTHFRVWAPLRKQVEVVIESEAAKPAAERQAVKLERETDGYFSAAVRHASAGMLYRFRLDDDDKLYPDPASRFQPQGPHGPSQIIDPSRFKWSDGDWKGARLKGQVIYEMHIGTFAREGSWESARAEFQELSELGITLIEVMPVHEFPGRFGWGYDGVDLFAPTHLYGAPDDFRRFVDSAHAAGMGVILDVVYNHFGPDGNYLRQFSEDYFTDKHITDWGEAINFYDKNCEPVREFVTQNAAYWIDEFHLDGLRLDATQNIYDESNDHMLAAITRRARAAARGRSVIIIAENEPQLAKLARDEEQGGYGIDALWNDDFHHSAMVAMTGRNEAYYTDYFGKPQEFISSVKYGYLYQGQRYKWQKQRRGAPAFDLEPAAFVTFIQNHDQIANTALGERCHQMTSPGRYKAMTALMLLSPGTPMLFQGQEFAASAPFLFFADHGTDLARLVREGRAEFLEQFRSIATKETQAILNDPSDPATFERCKLDFAERERHAGIYAMHRDLLKLRREDKLFSAQRKRAVDGATLTDEAFVLRYFGDDGDDRLLIVNLGRDVNLDPAPEPLLAPPVNTRWNTLWSSEATRYGGGGTAPLDTEDNWRIPGHSAVALAPVFYEESKTERIIMGDKTSIEIRKALRSKKDE